MGLMVENNIMIDKRCWKARKGCGSRSVDYCINSLRTASSSTASLLIFVSGFLVVLANDICLRRHQVEKSKNEPIF
jgi:hypothetical protein